MQLQRDNALAVLAVPSRGMGRPRTKPLVVFGERLHEALRKSGFKTKTALLRQLDDVPAMTLHRYEVGEGIPPMDLVGRLADLLGVTADYLMGRDTPRPDVVMELAADYGLSILDQALGMLALRRAGGRLEPALKQHLRAYAELHPPKTDDPLSTLFKDLEGEIRVWDALQADRALRTKEADFVEVTPREGAMERKTRTKR